MSYNAISPAGDFEDLCDDQWLVVTKDGEQWCDDLCPENWIHNTDSQGTAWCIDPTEHPAETPAQRGTSRSGATPGRTASEASTSVSLVPLLILGAIGVGAYYLLG